MAKKQKFSTGQIEQIRSDFGLTSKEISKLTESQARSLQRKLDKRDRPRARAAYARLIEADDEGEIQANAVENALRQLDSARARAKSKPMVAGIPCGTQVAPMSLFVGPGMAPGAGVAQSGWTAIGPGNVGGRTRAIVVDPSDPNTIWAGSAGGGVWKSANGGGSWSPVNDMMANLAICCMAVDPSDDNIVYAGTGEGFFNVDALRGAGVFLTKDKVTWDQLPSTNNPNFHYVNRIAVSKNGKILLAGTSGPTAGTHGIFRSDELSRATWTKVFDERIGDIKFNPKSSTKAVAGGLRNGEAYYTTNGGKTWKKATHSGVWSGRVELAYSLKDPDIVYASIQVNNGEIWRSTDGGKTYRKRKSLNADGDPAMYLGGQGWYDNTIWAGDPSDSNLVIVGGIDLWRSTNGGTLLSKISDWRENKSAHADHHAIVSHPDFDGNSNKVVFFGNDGGVYRTDNAETVGNNSTHTSGWVNLVNGYAVTQFYGGAGKPDTGTIIGGAQDNGTLSNLGAPSGADWVEIHGGDGGYCAADPDDSKKFYGEYTHLAIFRNTDGAKSKEKWWETYINGQFVNSSNQWDWKPVPFRISDSMNERALFIAPFILDPNESSRMLAGGESLWKTDNVKKANTNTSGPSWKVIKPSIGTDLNISAIAIADGNEKKIWVGYQTGLVEFTENGTDSIPTWQQIGTSGNNPLNANRFCTRVVVDPKRHKTVYVMFGGYVQGNIWKTTDEGANWTNIGSSLPEAPIRSLALHPRKSKFLYLGTEVGVFTSEDGGASWSPTNEGPTNCSIAELFWMDEKLVCVTHGRGMFTIDLSGV